MGGFTRTLLAHPPHLLAEAKGEASELSEEDKALHAKQKEEAKKLTTTPKEVHHRNAAQHHHCCCPRTPPLTRVRRRRRARGSACSAFWKQWRPRRQQCCGATHARVETRRRWTPSRRVCARSARSRRLSRRPRGPSRRRRGRRASRAGAASRLYFIAFACMMFAARRRC